MKKLISQIFKFGVTGVICFLIQTGILTALTELFGVPYMISSFIGFTVSVIVNYIMSITIVFEPDRQCGKVKQFSVFLILSIIGLGIYQILMWLITPWLEKYMSRAYMLVNIGTTVVVMVYNFITRKIFIEKKTDGIIAE